MKDFNYYADWAISHINALIQKVGKNELKELKKSFSFQIDMMIEKSRSFPPGTIREWQGKKYKKLNNGKWARFYGERNTRADITGIVRSLKNLSRNIEMLKNDSSKSEAEKTLILDKYISDNIERFKDKSGNILKEARELHEMAMSYRAKKDEASQKEKRETWSKKLSDKNKFEFTGLSDNEKKKKKDEIQKNIVAQIKADSVPYDNSGAYDKAAEKWLENNPQKSAWSSIGEIIINKKSVARDMHHGEAQDKYLKLQTLPAVKSVLEHGIYLGYEKDFDGKPIDNHYFAGKIKYGNDEKIIFCRVRENKGEKNRFYVHEVFTEDEIKNGLAVRKVNGSLPRFTSKPLYKYILQDLLNVKENNSSVNEKIISKEQQKEIKGFPALYRTVQNNIKIVASNKKNLKEYGGFYRLKRLDSETAEKFKKQKELIQEQKEALKRITAKISQYGTSAEDLKHYEKEAENVWEKYFISAFAQKYGEENAKVIKGSKGTKRYDRDVRALSRMLSFIHNGNYVGLADALADDFSAGAKRIVYEKLTGEKLPKTQKGTIEYFLNKIDGDISVKKSLLVVQKSFFDEYFSKRTIPAMQKSLTWSGYELQGRTTWNGLNISIENKKGSVRRGVDKDGHKWATKMHFDYGYIRGTEGTDGDHVDCYLGGNKDAKKVYIVHQNDPVTHKYDEDKCMLGFDTLVERPAIN